MKLGTENKKKTLAAVALMALAVLLFARTMMAPRSSDASATPAKPALTPAAQQALAASTTSQSKRQDYGRPQRKTLAMMIKPSLDPRLRLDLLKDSEDVKYEGTGRNIFDAESAPEIPTPKGPAMIEQRAAAQPQGPPPPPPINLKFFGWARKTGSQKSIFLAQGDSVFAAHEGDIVAGRYRVMKINPTSVQIQDVLSNNTQTIPLTQG